MVATKPAPLCIPVLPSITSTAEVLASAGDFAPFPYIHAAFGVVVIVLKAVEAMKKNRRELRELYESVERFHGLFEEHVKQRAVAAQLDALCQKLQIEETMKEVLQTVEQIRTKLLSSRVLALVLSRSISEEIKGLQDTIVSLITHFNTVVGLDTNRRVQELQSRPRRLALRKPEALGSLPQRLTELHTEVSSKIDRLGDDVPDTLLLLAQLAREYAAVGQHELAEEIQQHVLQAYRKQGGEDEHNELSAMGNLAVTYMNLGRLEDAERLATDVVNRRVAGSSAEADLLRSMSNLALVKTRLDKYAEAKNLQRDVYSARKKSLGLKHPDTILAMTNLAISYRKLGRPKDAKLYQEYALSTLGEDHADSLAVMTSLAITCGDLKEYEEAKRLKMFVLGRLQQEKGDTHPETLRAMLSLAITYKDLKLPQKAKTHEERVVAERKRKLGEDHVETLEAMSHLADSYYQLDEFAQSADLEVDLLARYSRLFGERDQRTRRIMRNLANTYRNLKMADKVKELETRLQSVI